MPVRAELLAHVAQLGARLSGSVSRYAEDRRTRLRSLARGLPQPDQILALPRQRLDALDGRLRACVEAVMVDRRNRLGRLSAMLAPARLVDMAARDRLRLDRLARDLPLGLSRGLALHRRDLAYHAGRLTPRASERLHADGVRRLAQATARLDRAALHAVAEARGRTTEATRLLKSLSYESVLERGYALVRNETGAPVRSSSGIATGDRLTVQFAGDDRLDVIADRAETSGRPSSGKPKPKTGPAKGGQGSLF